MAPFPKPSVLHKAARAIHPQLPLDSRQSQQLLQILRTSFQNQLDSAHPPIETRNERQMEAEPFETSKDPAKLHKSFGSDGSYQPASSAILIDRILSNPLLSTKPSPAAFMFGEHFEALPLNLSISDASRAKKWFQRQLTYGDVGFPIVRYYLTAIHRLMPSSSAPATKIRIKELEAGKDVLRWLRTTSPAQVQSFWVDNPERGMSSLSMLVKCLTAEDCLQEIQDLLTRDVLEDEQYNDGKLSASPRRRTIVDAWLTWSLKLELDIEEILQNFMDLFHICQAQFVQQVEGTSPGLLLRLIFGGAGSRLAIEVTAPGRSIPSTLYSSFLSSSRVWARNLYLGRAFLSLYHPTDINPIPAMHYMERFGSYRLTNMPETLRRRLLKMCLDSAQQFLSQKDLASGTKMLEYARLYFARELGGDFTNVGAKRSEGLPDDAQPSQDQRNSVKAMQHLDHLVPG